jgi:hypothetical protein
LVPFGGGPEAFEAFIPEVLEPGPELGRAGRPGAIEAADAVATLGDKASLAQDREVLADRWTCHIEPAGDLAGRQLTIADEGENRPAAGLGKGSKGGVHPTYVSRVLRKCQLTR